MYNNVVSEVSSDPENKVYYFKHFNKSLSLLPLAQFKECQGCGWGHLIRVSVHSETGFFPGLGYYIGFLSNPKGHPFPPAALHFAYFPHFPSLAKAVLRGKATSVVHLSRQLVSPAP